MRRIYLDHAASTPVDPRVLRTMAPYFSKEFGNPGSLHSFGQKAIAAVDHARETIANAVGADFREIIFTSSATEANNLVMRGVVAAFRKEHQNITPKIIVSSIEHESVLETAKYLSEHGVEAVYVAVDHEGLIDMAALARALDDRTAFVSIMYANNEIGTIEPVAHIAATVRAFRDRTKSLYPIFHTDAAQAFQFFDCRVDALGIDMMTLSSQKIYGPKGAGALYVRGAKENGKAGRPEPIITGGGQEFGFRSGTENVPAIVGFARAVELLSSRDAAKKKMAAMRGELIRGIKAFLPQASVNGPAGAALALPNILNIYLPGHATQDVLTGCDLRGLAISSGSACRSRAIEPSHVLHALGRPERGSESVRISFGRTTTKEEIRTALRILKAVLN